MMVFELLGEFEVAAEHVQYLHSFVPVSECMPHLEEDDAKGINIYLITETLIIRRSIEISADLESAVKFFYVAKLACQFTDLQHSKARRYTG